MSALITMMQGISGMQEVHRGVPEGFGRTVNAYVAVGPQTPIDKAGGLLQRETTFFVGLGYEVAQAEATAEDTLADMLDAFLTQFYADRKNSAGLFAKATTHVESGELDLSLAGTPQYQVMAGQEFRVFPILVRVTQQANT